MRSGFATGIQVISNSSEDVDFYIHELYPIHFCLVHTFDRDLNKIRFGTEYIQIRRNQRCKLLLILFCDFRLSCHQALDHIEIHNLEKIIDLT